MKTKSRYDVYEIPSGATHVISRRYAKILDNILYIWQSDVVGWVSTGKTLVEYNDYQVFEYHEYPLDLIMFVELKERRMRSRSGFDLNNSDQEYWIFRDWDNEYKISLYKPKIKGFKGVDKRDRYSGGETIIIRKELYPQLDDMVGNNILGLLPNSKYPF